jgi:hypothetical protein
MQFITVASMPIWSALVRSMFSLVLPPADDDAYLCAPVHKLLHLQGHPPDGLLVKAGLLLTSKGFSAQFQ